MPLTLAIIEGFLLGVGDEVYVMPIAGVVRCLDLSSSGHPGSADGVLNIDGEAVPFLRLRAAFDMPAARGEEIAVVVRKQGQLVGVAADRLLGRKQVVVKPLGPHLAGLPAFSGLTILGDGTVAPILNVAGLLRHRLDRSAGASEASAHA